MCEKRRLKFGNRIKPNEPYRGEQNLGEYDQWDPKHKFFPFGFVTDYFHSKVHAGTSSQNGKKK